MPEIDICRSCSACADPTDAESQLIEDARMWKLQQRNVDDLFAERLHVLASRRFNFKKLMRQLPSGGTKKISD
jgi:hypothetical protein